MIVEVYLIKYNIILKIDVKQNMSVISFTYEILEMLHEHSH